MCIRDRDKSSDKGKVLQSLLGRTRHWQLSDRPEVLWRTGVMTLVQNLMDEKGLDGEDRRKKEEACRRSVLWRVCKTGRMESTEDGCANLWDTPSDSTVLISVTIQ